MSSLDTDVPVTEESAQIRRLSYKFQRLRERIRDAIESGELGGKLPGERVLARRFKVNAKTLSKALTDLAAEGLLERNIGLGTFVRGAAQPKQVHKCLVLHDADDASALISALACDELELQPHDNPDNMPPSLLNPHRSIVVSSQKIGDDVIRTLVVRGKNVILVDRLLPSYSTHAVMVDRAGAAASLVRRLVAAGHRKIMIVDTKTSGTLFDEVSQFTTGMNANLRAGTLDDLQSAVADGVTGFICTTVETARHAADALKGEQGELPAGISLMAVGRTEQEPEMSGQYVKVEEIAVAVRQLLSEAAPHRPITLWLSGSFVDQGTLKPIA